MGIGKNLKMTKQIKHTPVNKTEYNRLPQESFLTKQCKNVASRSVNCYASNQTNY